MLVKFDLIRFITKRFFRSGRNKRFINFARLVAIISVMLGSMALIVSLAVLGGYETSLRENAVKFRAHITMRTFKNMPVRDYSEKLKVLPAIFPDIQSLIPVIEREGLVRSKHFVEGIMIRGMAPEYDITQMKRNIVEGSFNFSSGKSLEIIIGRRLARKLNVKIGDTLIVYAVREEGSSSFAFPDIDKFKVNGIYETGMAMYDDIYAFIPFDVAAAFFKIPDNSSTSIDIILKDIEQAQPLSEKISSFFGYPYYCYTVFDLHRAIFAWIEFQKEPIPLVLGLISVVAVMNIITILLITVVEKTHSIGVLRALGMNNRGILSIFLFQGVSIGLAGALSGCGLGFAFSWLQQTYGIIKLQGEIYMLDTLPIHISLWHYELVLGCSLLLSFLATLVPSLIAVRITPVRAIRFK